MEKELLKGQVKDYWNNQACGTQYTDKDKYTLEYFEEIENERYSKEPEIFSFAQFSRYHGKKILEVGLGAGTDFLQWVRSGADAFGIDLTPEAVEHVEKRLSLYNLSASEIKVADSEHLPYPDNTFDLVYSWGVIHHTPNTENAFSEIYRVCKPGGKCKVMIYHRHSLLTFFFWVKHALLKGKPFKSFASVLWDHMESIGTKAYTTNEVREILKDKQTDNLIIKPILSYYDLMKRFNPVFQGTAKFLAWILGRDRVGWFLTIEFDKSK